MTVTVDWNDGGWSGLFKSEVMLAHIKAESARIAETCDGQAKAAMNGPAPKHPLYYSGATMGRNTAVGHVSTSETLFRGKPIATILETKHHFLKTKCDNKK